MAAGYTPLPAYRIDNAMINFKPMADGIDAFVKGEKQGYERTNAMAFGQAMADGDQKAAMIAGAKIDPRVAMEAGLYSGKKESQDLDIRLQTAKLLSGHAQTILDMKDPEAQREAASKWLASDPKFANGLGKMGIPDWQADPIGSVKAIHAEALGAQDPEHQALVRAQTAHQSVMAGQPGASIVNINPGAPGAQGQTGQVVHSTPTKLNPDYEYIDPANPAAGVRPRPGGNADTKQLEKQQAARANLDASNQNLDLLIANIRELHSPAVKDDKGTVVQEERTHPGLPGNFGWSGKLPNWPGGDAANANAKLEQLRARGGFEALNAMRQASKTGGALGSVSDAEGKQLQNSFAALQSAQGDANVKMELAKVLKQVEMSKQRINAAYERQYNNPGPTPPGQPAQYSGSQGRNGPSAGPAVDKPNTGSLPPQIQSDEDYSALPPGPYRDPDGNIRMKR